MTFISRRLPTAQDPFCAGIVVADATHLLMTLGDQDRWRPSRQGGLLIPLSGIGGGQDPNEAPVDCALREAREEVGVDAEILPVVRTWWSEDCGMPKGVPFPADAPMPAPFLVAALRRRDSAPFRPGLPGGDILRVVLYRARLTGTPRPHDIPGLIQIPLGALTWLATPRTLADIQSVGGGELLANVTIPPDTRFVIRRRTGDAVLGAIVARHGPEALAA
jgi:hypothetical protein